MSRLGRSKPQNRLKSEHTAVWQFSNKCAKSQIARQLNAIRQSV